MDVATLWYAIALPGRKSAFRARLWPESFKEITEMGPPAGRRADFGAFPVAVQPKSGPEGPGSCMVYDSFRWIVQGDGRVFKWIVGDSLASKTK